MKIQSASVILAISVVNVNAAEEGLTYTPNNDVTSHSKIALDVLDISELIDAGNVTQAFEIYQDGKNREGKSLQAMARKDWVAAELNDVSDYDAYAALFNQGDGEPFLDSFNRDAMFCNNTFEGHTTDMCKIAAKKNLVCTGLQYAQYEAINAIQYGNEKNWDELYAFWNGVYDESIDIRVNSGGPAEVQIKRDSDFGTSFHEDSLKAIIDGQKAFSSGTVDTAKLIQAYDDFNKANLATFTQAALKYSALFDEKDLEQTKVDGKWGEGYTYFRCGAGLMDPELALYIDYVLDPRDKKGVDLTPKETVCKIVNKMLSLEEIGMGVKIGDLNIEKYLPTIKADCGLNSLSHAEGVYRSKNERVWIPIIGILVVIGLYIGGYFVVKRRKEHQL